MNISEMVIILHIKKWFTKNLDYSVMPEKLECMGHVQKRLGTRLCTKMKEYKGTATPLSGTGKLTGKTISSMQTYYGKAIRSNSNEFYVLANELWHCTEVDDSDY